MPLLAGAHLSSLPRARGVGSVVFGHQRELCLQWCPLCGTGWLHARAERPGSRSGAADPLTVALKALLLPSPTYIGFSCCAWLPLTGRPSQEERHSLWCGLATVPPRREEEIQGGTSYVDRHVRPARAAGRHSPTLAPVAGASQEGDTPKHSGRELPRINGRSSEPTLQGSEQHTHDTESPRGLTALSLLEITHGGEGGHASESGWGRKPRDQQRVLYLL